MPVFAKEMGASGIWLGLAFSGFTLTQVPLMPVVGRLSDRFNKKFFLWFGLIIYAITAVGYYWAPSFYELVIFRILSGIGSAMVVPIAFSYIGELAPHGHEGRYMGLFSMALIAGFGLGPMFGGIIHDSLGTDATFISMGILSIAGFIIIYLFLPKKIQSPDLTNPSDLTENEGGSPSFISLFGDNTIRGIITLQSVFGVLFGTVLAFIGIWMTNVIGTSVALVGILLSARSLTNGIFAYPFGWLADRVNKVHLITFGMGVVVIGTFSIPWMESFAPLLGLFTFMGIFESMAMPSINAITVEKGRSLGMGSVMGVFNMSISIGLIIGSMAGGIIESSFGIVMVFRFAASLGLVGIIAFNLFMRRSDRDPSK